MQGANHFISIIAWYEEAKVIAAGTVADHTQMEGFQYAKHLFTHPTSFGQIVADQCNQRQTLFHLNTAQ